MVILTGVTEVIGEADTTHQCTEEAAQTEEDSTLTTEVLQVNMV